MPGRRLIQYDSETGEVFDGALVYVAKRVPHPYGVRMMQVNQDFLAEFAARQDVKGQTLRVFLYLASRCDFENWLQVPQIEIADALTMQRADVTRSVQQLVDLGVLLKGPKVGRSNTFRFNPNAGWKGKVKNLRPVVSPRLKVVAKDGPTQAELEAMGQRPLPLSGE
jgi:hypothetical protein